MQVESMSMLCAICTFLLEFFFCFHFILLLLFIDLRNVSIQTERDRDRKGAKMELTQVILLCEELFSRESS